MFRVQLRAAPTPLGAVFHCVACGQPAGTAGGKSREPGCIVLYPAAAASYPNYEGVAFSTCPLTSLSESEPHLLGLDGRPGQEWIPFGIDPGPDVPVGQVVQQLIGNIHVAAPFTSLVVPLATAPGTAVFPSLETAILFSPSFLENEDRRKRYPE